MDDQEIHHYLDSAGGSEVADITQDYGTDVTAPAAPDQKVTPLTAGILSPNNHARRRFDYQSYMEDKHTS